MLEIIRTVCVILIVLMQLAIFIHTFVPIVGI